MEDYLMSIVFIVFWLISGLVPACFLKEDGFGAKTRILAFSLGFISLGLLLVIAIFFCIKEIIYDD